MMMLAIAYPLPLSLPELLFILLRLITPKITASKPNGIPSTNKPAIPPMNPASPSPSNLLSSVDNL